MIFVAISDSIYQRIRSGYSETESEKKDNEPEKKDNESEKKENDAEKEVDVIKLNHYTNLQPLCSKENRDLK